MHLPNTRASRSIFTALCRSEVRKTVGPRTSSRRTAIAVLAGSLVLAGLAHGSAAVEASTGRAVYERTAPSMVAVQFVWENEMRRQEIICVGVAIAPDTVMVSSSMIPEQIPESQIKEFKIVVPRKDADHDELDAVFVGRDDRHEAAFLRLKDPAAKTLAPVTFVDKPVEVGDTVYSVGLMPKSQGYNATLHVGTVSAKLRGEIKSVQVLGALANAGGVVFNAAGEAVGVVPPHDSAFPWLEPRLNNRGASNFDDARLFIPAFEFLPSLASIPKGDAKYPPVPFTGIMSLNGLTKDLAEVFDLVGKPAVEIGDVVPNTPAAKAGLEKGMIITELDGQALERGDEPEELGPIMGRKIRQKKVGDTVTLTVIPKKGEPAKKVEMTLAERPLQASAAPRFFAEDLGFTVRDAVFIDRYQRKLTDDAKGVVIDFIKPSSSAQSGRMARGDMITQMNGAPVTDVAGFKAAYEAFRKEKPTARLVLQVLREGNTQILNIEPPQ